MVPLTATGPEVYVAIMTTFISDSYDALEETLNHMKSLKLKSYPGENVADCCAAILVDAERLESAGALMPEHLGYIIRIFEDTSDSRFRLWAIQKYKQVTEFIKKLRVCDMDVLSQEDLITYKSLFFLFKSGHRDQIACLLLGGFSNPRTAATQSLDSGLCSMLSKLPSCPFIRTRLAPFRPA